MRVRLYLPRRVLDVANCGSFGHEEYPELGTRFKAAHIKIMCWWIAVKVQELAKDSEAQHLKTYGPNFSHHLSLLHWFHRYGKTKYLSSCVRKMTC